jgi:hypothetical protein
MYSAYVPAVPGEPPLAARVPWNREKWALFQSCAKEFAELVEDSAGGFEDATDDFTASSLRFVTAAADILNPVFAALSPDNRKSMATHALF